MQFSRSRVHTWSMVQLMNARCHVTCLSISEEDGYFQSCLLFHTIYIHVRAKLARQRVERPQNLMITTNIYTYTFNIRRDFEENLLIFSMESTSKESSKGSNFKQKKSLCGAGRNDIHKQGEEGKLEEKNRNCFSVRKWS